MPKSNKKTPKKTAAKKAKPQKETVRRSVAGKAAPGKKPSGKTPAPKKSAKAAAGKKAPAAAKGAARPLKAGDISGRIAGEADRMYQEVLDVGATSMEFPVRSLNNVEYSEDEGYLKLLGRKVERKLSYVTVKTFAQSLRMMAEAKNLIDTKDIASKREIYYVAKGDWGECKFGEQSESDSVMDDIEALFEVNREELRFIPEEKGGEVAGRLKVLDINPSSGKEVVINCEKFGK